MSAVSIINSWKKKEFKPFYWLEGEEEFFIDEIMDYAEKNILPETEASFNLTVFYGKDAEWPDIINACRRYPMFAERQVVLLKEAQQLKLIDKLEPYFENPLASTIFIVSYKGKTIDGRSKLAKVLKKNGEVFLSKKVYENQLQAWTNGYLQSKGMRISSKALALLVDHIGNDLGRIANEVNKLSLNIKDSEITENEIEKYIGISKDYNIFEFQSAFGYKDAAKAIKIIQYFDANPKAVPQVQVLPTLYAYFTKIMSIYQMRDRSNNAIRPLFYNNPVLVEQAMATLSNYTFAQLEEAVLLLHYYNLKSIGIDNYGASFYSLLKELCYKVIQNED
ncbi:MAG: DNA polymerase III subunit delta [Bacteroidetes bacterium]|nr:DNA polymerase III subunit delta [Bacteroidota bacterium]